jgi:hypothetical protein
VGPKVRYHVLEFPPVCDISNMLATRREERLVRHEPQSRGAIINLRPVGPWIVFGVFVIVDGEELQLYFYWPVTEI